MLGLLLFLAGGALAWPQAWAFMALIIATGCGYREYAAKVRFRLVPRCVVIHRCENRHVERSSRA